MKRTDLKKIAILGAGPIIIGQACEFDYSGTQACKALREEGYEVVLINSNPATIMTDPETADRTYIEPITPEFVAAVLRKERPDALLPTLGGQTALNVAMRISETDLLEELGIEMIGANREVIRRAEDRELFRETMRSIGVDLPKSELARSREEALVALHSVGFPCVIRPAFTLGGTGGGIAYNHEEFNRIVHGGLAASMVGEVLIEEYLAGWKEFEMEMMRDRNDNVVVICSIENFDPMGVHTGDSITVAPVQTLTDREYQQMRDASLKIIRAVGVETGGCNIQFAQNPKSGRFVAIEMNPRVSRSSALASKATGYPIAKIAAKLAVGYTLDELRNDITGTTSSCFEPTIDYCVVKMPRFSFEKFPEGNAALSVQMKSVGEAMGIGRTFKEALHKAIRSLEMKRYGLLSSQDQFVSPSASPVSILREIAVPTKNRIFQIATALKLGVEATPLSAITGIDPWFLAQIEELTREDSAIDASILDENESAKMLKLKRLGFSDHRLGEILGCPEEVIRNYRTKHGITAVRKMVDTCGAEFEAQTPYYYTTYGEEDEAQQNGKTRNAEKPAIMILGGGPNRIGQGIEFDYCCVHAAYTARKLGVRSIMVNCNPETVSTDYDTSDTLYFDPLTLEDVLGIIALEKPKGVILQFGGQTPLNLASELTRAGIPILGTGVESITLAEDRKRFSEILRELDLKQPEGATATTLDEAMNHANRIGFPVMMRPSFVLGGAKMEIVFDSEDMEIYWRELLEYGKQADLSIDAAHPILIDRFLENAMELDVDAVSGYGTTGEERIGETTIGESTTGESTTGESTTGETTTIGEECVVAAIMEHIEEAGIHSGDSACSFPPRSLTPQLVQSVEEATQRIAKRLHVRGLLNIQFAVQDDEIYVLEVNPRASRTIPFICKTLGFPLVETATKIMLSESRAEIAELLKTIPDWKNLSHIAVKESVFPWTRFPGVDARLGPEMKSTGEVMGIGRTFGEAFAKGEAGTGIPIPQEGTVFLSVKDADKPHMEKIARSLIELGFQIVATRGTGACLEHLGIPVSIVAKIVESERPNILDRMIEGKIQWLINTPSGKHPHRDEIEIRATAMRLGIPLVTTIRGVYAFLETIRHLRENPRWEVRALQEYF